MNRKLIISTLVTSEVLLLMVFISLCFEGEFRHSSNIILLMTVGLFGGLYLLEKNKR